MHPVSIILAFLHMLDCYTTADIGALTDVNDEVASLAAEWRGICTALGLLSEGEIAQACHFAPKECLKEVLRRWLKKEYDTDRHGLPTWRKLVEAVAKPAGGSNPAKAGKIAADHKKRQEAAPGKDSRQSK